MSALIGAILLIVGLVILGTIFEFLGSLFEMFSSATANKKRNSGANPPFKLAWLCKQLMPVNGSVLHIPSELEEAINSETAFNPIAKTCCNSSYSPAALIVPAIPALPQPPFFERVVLAKYDRLFNSSSLHGRADGIAVEEIHSLHTQTRKDKLLMGEVELNFVQPEIPKYKELQSFSKFPPPLLLLL